MSGDPRLVVVVVSGPEAEPRAVFGLASALTAAVSGIEVRVVLSMDGAHWAAEGTGASDAVADFPSIDELLGELSRCGVSIETNAESVERYCPRDERGLWPLRASIVVSEGESARGALNEGPSVVC